MEKVKIEIDIYTFECMRFSCVYLCVKSTAVCVCVCVFQSFRLPRSLHRCVQHESSRQAKASGKVVERACDSSPLRSAQRILCL